MREPRPAQRFPQNGKALFEALRRDAEPTLVWILSQEDERQVSVIQDYTLLWSRFFDPMLYFWPVEQQHVCSIFWTACDELLLKRLVKALLRDGAEWVTVSRPKPRGSDDGTYGLARIWENYGDVDKFMRSRAETVVPMGLPAGHS